jgi:hypothetical protein
MNEGIDYCDEKRDNFTCNYIYVSQYTVQNTLKSKENYYLFELSKERS